jgi:uncharacterized OB-fold protein
MPDSMIKTYYEGLGQNELRAVKCGACGRLTFPPTTACEHCGSFDVEWTTLSGEGELLFASHGMAPPPNPRFADIAPYTYGHVILKEGLPVQAIIRGVEPTPEALNALYQRGPVPVKAEVMRTKDLPVLTFRPV